MNRYKHLIFAVALMLPSIASAQESQSLTISSWGGEYEQAQLEAFVESFERDTGTQVDLRPYFGGIEPLRHRDLNDNPLLDVIDLVESDARLACELDMLSPLDRSLLSSAADGTSADKDFIADALLDCGIAHIEYATVVAYDERAFLEEKPSTIGDFFDIERFPGKRALQRKPTAVLEWAMLSYGIPPQQIYDLLSTERGLKLVTRRLNQIRDHIVWWESGAEPAKLLQDGTVVMASGYNGRFFEASINHDAPITVIQDGQLLEFGVWGINRDSPKQDAARAFIRYVTNTENMAAFSNLLPYAPTRESAMRRIGLHKKSNVSMLSYMPRASFNSKNVIRMASEWYSKTENVRERWFNDWLKSGLFR